MDEEKIGKQLIQMISPQNFSYYIGSKKVELKDIQNLSVLDFENVDYEEYNYCVTGCGEFIVVEGNGIDFSSDGIMSFEAYIKVDNDKILSVNNRIDLRSLHPC